MSLARVPDAVLIDASRAGDRAAFAAIVERYQRAVYAVSFAGVRDHALSDDITQDTFVLAWRRLAELRDGERLPAWLCGIARNLARDARKRRSRHESAELEHVVDDGTPFDALSDAESERIIATALATVPVVYREALVLFYYEQRSIDEVARLLAITPHTAHKRLSRGRQQLASRVAAIVERTVGARGPKRDLAACVTAAIAAVGAGESAAHASPAATQGSMMPKLAIATVVVTSIAGVGLLAAGPTTQPKPAASPKPTSTAAGASGAAASSAKVAAPPVAPAGAKRAPAAPALATPGVTAAARYVPNCMTVGRHMAELELAGFPSHKHFPAAKRAAFIEARAKDRSRRCAEERWSEERRICVLGADDFESTRVDCVEGIVATPDELAAIPHELGCAVVAKHFAALMVAPDGKLAIVAKKLGPKANLADMGEQARAQQAAACERVPWSLAVRRCIIASKTHQDTASCL